jgi:hypothetical protein
VDLRRKEMAKGHKSFSSKPSMNYARYLTQQQRARSRGELYTTLQMCEDAAVIALNNKLGIGSARAAIFIREFREVLNEISEMAVSDNDDGIVYIKVKTDRRMQAIMKDRFIPWEERYKIGERV